MKIDDLPDYREFWDRPEPPVSGEQSDIPVLIGVAIIISTWETLEDLFAQFFRLLIEAPTHAAARAYGSIASSHGRRTALREAAEVFFVRKHVTKEDKARFNLLLQHFGQASKRRDDVAHGFVRGIRFNNEGDYQYFCVPPDYNSNFTEAHVPQNSDGKWDLMRWDYRYSRANLDNIDLRLRRLQLAFFEFHDYFIGKYCQS